MKYADFMAFPFPQHELITKKRGLKVSPNILLDLCHTTSVPPPSVPPYAKKTNDIFREHQWFVKLLQDQENSKKTVYFFGLQHPPENAQISDLLLLKGMGIRFMTLAYEGKNEYGGGFATPDEPLNDAGERLIKSMTETGIVLDLSHAGHRTARDAINFIQQKSLNVRVVATHTACHTIYAHGRCLPDDVLCGIRDLGGIIGLVTITWMLHNKNNSIRPFLDHLFHLVELLGEENVCLGTDGVYHRLNVAEGRKRFAIMKTKIDPRGIFHARYPEQPAELNRPDKLLVIEKELSSLGWSPERIEKIIGGNLIRFFLSLL